MSDPSGTSVSHSRLTAFDGEAADRLAAAVPGLRLKPADPRYLEEPRGKYRSIAGFVAVPRNTDEVAAVVRHANTQRFGIVPYGGGTGLVGGQVALDGAPPLVLSLEAMHSIREVFPSERALIAEAGATIQSIQDAAADVGLLFPLSYGSKGTAQIGAGLAVNSGGINVLRYGMARNLCLGVEAVLPNGEVLHGLKRLRKDNTGYDLRHLLIGSEGTLGIITAAALGLAPKAARSATAFLDVAGPEAALELLARLVGQAGEVVSAFELMSGVGFKFLRERFPGTRLPFPHIPDWSVLIEIGTGASTDPQAVIEVLFEAGLDDGLIHDGLIASSRQQEAEFWAVRETIPEANRAIGAVASHDISLPLSEIPAFIRDTGPEVLSMADVRINAFGHLGDGNLHYNVFPTFGRAPSDYSTVAPNIVRLVHDRVAALGGSVSAEHGIGRMKTGDLVRYGDAAKISAMRAIKSALDPNGIMNPGAVLPTC